MGKRLTVYVPDISREGELFFKSALWSRLEPELYKSADGFGAGRGIFSAPFLNLAHQFIRDADPVQRLCAGSRAALFTFNGN